MIETKHNKPIQPTAYRRRLKRNVMRPRLTASLLRLCFWTKILPEKPELVARLACYTSKASRNSTSLYYDRLSASNAAGKNEEGSASEGTDWVVFWKGLAPADIAEAIHYCSKKGADFL